MVNQKVISYIFLIIAFFALTTKATYAASTSFFDHFDSPDLDTRWVALTSGSGVLNILDSYAECNSPQAQDACAFYYNTKIDKTKSGLWVFALSNHSGSFPQPWVSLVNSSTPPAADTNANYNLKNRITITSEQISTTKGIIINYWDSIHAQKRWNGSTNTWTTSPVFANSPIESDDYYLVGFEVDGQNSRWRAMVWSKRSPTGGFQQGLRLFTLTNWVSWSTMENTDNLYLITGDPITDALSGTTRTEWVRFDNGPRQEVWTNGKGSQGSPYSIRHGWGYEAANGQVEFVVQEDRTTNALAKGALGTWDSTNVKDPYVLFDPADANYYLFYSGGTNGYGYQIGLSSKNTPNGAFSKHPGNPIISSVAGTFEALVFNPAVVKDNNEADVSKRFKMLYNGFYQDNFRIFLATAPSASGPWTKQGLILDVGPAGSFDQNGFARPRPIFYNNQWYVFLGAKNNAETGSPWRVTYATGPTLDNLTRSGVILVDKGVGPAQNITSNITGRNVSVGSTTGFVKDAFVEIDQDTNANNYSQSRIRKILDSTTLELYHGLNGFTTTTPAKIVQTDGANRIEIADVLQVGDKWVMYVTPFHFFGAFPNIAAHDENTGMLVADSITGAYVWKHLTSPVITRGSWNNQVSNENMSLVHLPIGP